MRTLQQLMSLQSRTVVISGGAGHIGRAFCEALTELGAHVCVVDIAGEQAQSTAQEMQQRFAVECSSVAIDLTNEQQIKTGVAAIAERYGSLDVLVNNACYHPRERPPDAGRDLEQQSLAEWRMQLQLLLDGAFLLTRECIPLLRKSENACIINVASTYGLVGPDMRLYQGTDMRNPAWYAAGKGGIVQLTRYWATSLAPRIRVNCIAPGGVWRDQPESFHQAYCSRTPLGRMASEEDFKGAIAYLASDLSAYVTGQVLVVDGGWTAW